MKLIFALLLVLPLWGESANRPDDTCEIFLAEIEAVAYDTNNEISFEKLFSEQRILNRMFSRTTIAPDLGLLVISHGDMVKKFPIEVVISMLMDRKMHGVNNNQMSQFYQFFTGIDLADDNIRVFLPVKDKIWLVHQYPELEDYMRTPKEDPRLPPSGPSIRKRFGEQLYVVALGGIDLTQL